MAHDDKSKEYPCACGKVFRRQLALERHVDVHHSSRTVAHKCEVCGKTFGSRNTLTMHRTVHGTQATGFRGDGLTSPPSPKINVGQDQDKGSGVESVLESDSTIKTDFEATSERYEVKEEEEICIKEEEEEEDEILMSLKAETENENPKMSTIPRKLGRFAATNESSSSWKVSESIAMTTEIPCRRSAMTLSNVHVPTESRSGGDSCFRGLSDSVGSVLDLFNGDSSCFSSSSDVGMSAQQSMEFTEMLVEEIVSDSLFLHQHASDQHLTSSTGDQSDLDWSPAEPCVSEASPAGLKPHADHDRLAESRTQRQPTRGIDATGDSQLVHRRTTKFLRPEGSKRNHDRSARQSRFSEEADIEISEDVVDSPPSGRESRQLNNSNRTPFICALCHKSFDSEKYLSMHMPLHKPSYVETTEATRGVPVASIVAGAEADVVQLLQSGGLPGGSAAAAAKLKKVVAAAEMQQWTCQYCNKSFMQNSNYKNHMRTHSDERPFVCEMCNIGFKERYHLKKHVLFKHTTDLKETCRVCGKCFKDSTAVRAHERIHSELRPYSCNLCGKTFKTSECLWHHENRSKTCGKSALRRNDALAVAAAAVSMVPAQHPQNEPGSTNAVRRVRKPRQSPGGGGGTKTRSPRQSQKTGQNCNLASRPCLPRPMDDEDDVAAAELLRSEIEASVLSIKTEPDCDLFDQSLQTFLSNEQDLKNILEIFDFDMHKDCSSTEETGSDLTDSDTCLAKESEDFPFNAKCGVGGGLECSKCAKKFSSSATFEKHMVMHNEERPYRCTLCDNGFKLKVHLKKHHLYRHSDEYPCECSICGKRFKDSSAVRLHERIHSSDRPFRCNCGKGFKTRENLWGHRNRGPCEKTQDFITNNIRLFRSAEFGPILGVPISSGSPIVSSNNNNHVTASIGGSLVEVGGRTISSPLQQHTPQSLQAVLLKTTQGTMTSRTPHSVQFVPSCVISTPGFSPGFTPGQTTSRQVKVATLRLIKPRACDAATYPTSILPTAIVTPIQREGTVQSSTRPEQMTNQQENSETTLKAVELNNPMTSKAQQGSISINPTSVNSSTSPLTSPGAVSLLTTTAADLAAAAGLRIQSSVAEKCPTVQKYLERRSSTASIRFLEMNNPVGGATTTASSGNRSDQEKSGTKTTTSTFKRRKLDSIGEDSSSVEGEEKSGRVQKQEDLSFNTLVFPSVSEGGAFSFADPESQESGSLHILDPLLPNSPIPACTSMYPDIEDYGEMKYDPNDPTLNIGDMYWGDSDNTLSSGWILENESLFSELSLTSNFGIL